MKTAPSRLPLCYYATGLQEGCPHNMYLAYAGYDKQDIVWARSVSIYNELNT
jgi:hypothetical protein